MFKLNKQILFCMKITALWQSYICVFPFSAYHKYVADTTKEDKELHKDTDVTTLIKLLENL